MKKTFTLALASLLSLSAICQVTLDEVKKVQDMWGKGKKALTTELLKLDAGQQAAFDKVYDGYLVERQKIGQERIALIDEYAKTYSGIDDAKSDFLAKGFFKNNEQLLKLHKRYYKKFSKVLSPAKAAQWVQLENYIDNVVRSEMQEYVPFLEPGQLKRKK